MLLPEGSVNRRSFLSLVSVAALSHVLPVRRYVFLNGLWRASADILFLEPTDTPLMALARGIWISRMPKDLPQIAAAFQVDTWPPVD